MHKGTWKNWERKIGRYFGSDRCPLSGSNSGAGTSSDTLHPRLYIEVKARKAHSAITLWRKVKELAAKEKKTPVVALCEKGKKGFWLMVHSDDLGVLLEEFKKAKNF